ncbi:MAG: four helix bundle protein [Pontiella sp.]
MGVIETFEDLDVYQLALELRQEIFQMSKRFPKEETYSLTDQVRRSSRSGGANITEAWSKRRYPAHFISKLSDSDGEQNETRRWIKSALLCNYLAQDEHDVLLTKCQVIGRKLGNMMKNSENWILRESA